MIRKLICVCKSIFTLSQQSSIAIIFNLISIFILVAINADAHFAYNPQALPPSKGRYPVGYDPTNRNRPFCNQSLSRKQVLQQRRRWTPPVGYCPATRREKLNLRQAQPDNLIDNDNYIEWDNHTYTDNNERVCTGIWVGNRILYKTCVVLKK